MSRVGMPASMLLDAWARDVSTTFGGTCYLVGSARESRDYNDVDVRLMLSDEQWERWFPGLDPHHGLFDVGWRTLCTALSLHAKAVTGLPVDFQIQQQSRANVMHPGSRDPLGITFRRTAEDPS